MFIKTQNTDSICKAINIDNGKEVTSAYIPFINFVNEEELQNNFFSFWNPLKLDDTLARLMRNHQ